MGSSDSGAGVSGESKTGEGVIGSRAINRVHGIGDSTVPTSNGVLGEKIGKGIGVSGTSRGGIGVYGKGATLAAQFDGLVSVNGNVSANIMNLAGDANVAGRENSSSTGSTSFAPSAIVQGRPACRVFRITSIARDRTV